MDTARLLEEVRSEIDRLQQVEKLLAGGSGPKRGRRKLSRKARAAIAKAQRDRWAKVRAAKKS